MHMDYRNYYKNDTNSYTMYVKFYIIAHTKAERKNKNKKIKK